MSKFINISYTILETIEVPDDATPDDIEEMIEIDMADKNIHNMVNDIEWAYGRD